MSFSSDWPCSWPPDPFFGVQQATLRQVRRQPSLAYSATEFNSPEERISVEQAIQAYTKNSAYARFSDKQLGTLEPGKYADLVVLSQDIFTAAPMDLGKTHPVITMVGGKIVYSQEY